MEIEFNEMVSDEYVVCGNGDYVYGAYDSLKKAVDSLKMYTSEYVKAAKMKIRHKITAFVDKDVDCAEII